MRGWEGDGGGREVREGGIRHTLFGTHFLMNFLNIFCKFWCQYYK